MFGRDWILMSGRVDGCLITQAGLFGVGFCR